MKEFWLLIFVVATLVLTVRLRRYFDGQLARWPFRASATPRLFLTGVLLLILAGTLGVTLELSLGAPPPTAIIAAFIVFIVFGPANLGFGLGLLRPTLTYLKNRVIP